MGEFKWGGGGTLQASSNEITRRTFWIKPLEETDLGMAQAFFDP